MRQSTSSMPKARCLNDLDSSFGARQMFLRIKRGLLLPSIIGLFLDSAEVCMRRGELNEDGMLIFLYDWARMLRTNFLDFQQKFGGFYD